MYCLLKGNRDWVDMGMTGVNLFERGVIQGRVWESLSWKLWV